MPNKHLYNKHIDRDRSTETNCLHMRKELLSTVTPDLKKSVRHTEIEVLK